MYQSSYHPFQFSGLVPEKSSGNVRLSVAYSSYKYVTFIYTHVLLEKRNIIHKMIPINVRLDAS